MLPANRCRTSPARSAQPNLRVHTDPDGWYRRRRPDRRQPSPVSPITTSTPTAWYRRASRAALTCTRVQDASQPTDHGAAGASHLCNCPIPTQTDGIADGVPTAGNPTLTWHDCFTHPLHGVAKRPERFRPAPVCKMLPSHRSWYRRSVPSVSRPHLCGTYRHCEEEGLSLLLRSTHRCCEEEGLSLLLRGSRRCCEGEGLSLSLPRYKPAV